MNPPINPAQSSEEEENNYASADENELNNLVSPNRPHQSPSASPRALLRPDPPVVEDVLEQVSQQLNNIPNRQQRAANRNAVRQAAELAAAEAAAASSSALRNIPDPLQDPPRMANYDETNVADEAGAYQNARDIKIPFNKADIRLWFTLVESKMQFAGINRQWSKRQVLVQLIPAELHNDFKAYLIQQEADAGPQAYKDFKDAIIKQFGPKLADGFDRAIARVMNGTPSQLERQIVNDICPEVRPLAGCHCAAVVLGIWRRSLPSVVRNAIADEDFTAATYKRVFEHADNVWASNSANTTVVAALAKASTDPDTVAAVQQKKNRRNNRGG